MMAVETMLSTWGKGKGDSRAGEAQPGLSKSLVPLNMKGHAQCD